MKDEQLENVIVALHGKGWSQRELSRKFDISRGRVIRILERNRYKRETGKDYQVAKSKRTSKLDAYREYISELLEEHQSPPITIQRVLELLREKGYDGGRTILGAYLSTLRGKKSKEPVICVETSPGQRGSHDWSEYYVYFSESRKKEKVIFFSFILNYSRRQYIEVVNDKTQLTLFKCLVNTFTYFDGVPRQVKSDNQKACVDRWEFGRPVFNKKLLDFATHYRFTPLSITPGKPRENLKIERPFYYLERNFLNGRSFYNARDLKLQLMDWLKNINDQRIHRTTKQSPAKLYEKEYPYLQALPGKHYDTSVKAYRIVNNESCVEWQGYFYVVPRGHLHETCLVRQGDSELIIYGDKNNELVRHPLAASDRTDKYIGRQQQRANPSKGLRTKEIISRLEPMGPVMEEYIAGLKKHKPGSFRHHLLSVLSLKANYQKEDIVIAVARALEYKVYEAGAIVNFLRAHADKKNEITLFPKKRLSHGN